MPTATPFNAFGKGNGFPTCLDKVDVSIYDKWITFGGYNSDGGGSFNLDLDLQRAMAFYWNLYAFDINASASALTSSISRTGNAIVTNSSGVSLPTPQNRQCSYREGYISESDTNTVGLSGSTYSISFNAMKVVRMYDGSTSNENNFRGLGYETSSTITASGSYPNTVSSVSISIGSFMNSVGGSFAFTTLGGLAIACKCIASASGLPSEKVEIENPSDLLVLAANAADQTSASVQINDLDFYVY